MQRGRRREGRGKEEGEGGGREYQPAQSMTSWALSLSCVYSVSLAPRLSVQTCLCGKIYHVLFLLLFLLLVYFIYQFYFISVHYAIHFCYISSDISSVTVVLGQVPHNKYYSLHSPQSFAVLTLSSPL